MAPAAAADQGHHPPLHARLDPGLQQGLERAVGHRDHDPDQHIAADRHPKGWPRASCRPSTRPLPSRSGPAWRWRSGALKPPQALKIRLPPITPMPKADSSRLRCQAPPWKCWVTSSGTSMAAGLNRKLIRVAMTRMAINQAGTDPHVAPVLRARPAAGSGRDRHAGAAGRGLGNGHKQQRNDRVMQR